MKPLHSFASSLMAWQRKHGRHNLPWQNTRDPYRVWLSEIMLQQTQVSTVLSYFERFLARFPDVQALAAAHQDDVLAQWSGLGYYSRARNLHRCAQTIVADHGGQFPGNAEGLAQLPGIGRSTAAAIAAFCFGERVAILDGNVKRVLTRVLAFDGDLALSAQEKLLWQHATNLLPSQGVEVYTQGLMDLGATVCLQRQPQCSSCPVRMHCQALTLNEQEVTRFPVKTRKLKRSKRENHWLWLQWQGQVWLTQRPQTGVWAGLWSLPEFIDGPALEALVARWPGESECLPSFVHVLTHLDWQLHPCRHVLPDALSKTALKSVVQHLPLGQWFSLDDAAQMGLPAPLRKWVNATQAAAARA